MKVLRLRAKTQIWSLVFIFFVLTGCAHQYNMLPANQTPSLQNVRQVYVSGPFQTQVYVGAKTPKIVMTTDQSNAQAKVIVKQYADVLQVQPTLSSSLSSVKHVILKIYVKNLTNLSIENANVVRIYSSPRANFVLNVRNTGYVVLDGGAVLPVLNLNNVGNFDAVDGPVYLNEVNFTGPGNVYIDNIAGGYVSINAVGPGYLKLNGNFKLISIVQQGGNLLDLSGNIQGGNITLKTNGDRHIRMNGIAFIGLQFEAYGKDDIELSGYVGQLNAALYGSSVLDGKFLTVQKAYVKTYDQATANFYVSQSIFAKALNQSRITYSGSPIYRYAYAKNSAAILPISPPTPNALNKGGWSIQ